MQQPKRSVVGEAVIETAARESSTQRRQQSAWEIDGWRERLQASQYQRNAVHLAGCDGVGIGKRRGQDQVGAIGGVNNISHDLAQQRRRQ